MNMIFELIGLLLVVGCAFFTTFFLAALCKQGGSEKSADCRRHDHDLSHSGVSNLRKPLHHLAD